MITRLLFLELLRLFEENRFFGSKSAKSRILNCDDSDANTNPNYEENVCQKVWYSYLIAPITGKGIYFILRTGNAEGVFLTLKAHHLNENWIQNGSPNSIYAILDSRWVSDEKSEKWHRATFVLVICTTSPETCNFLFQWIWILFEIFRNKSSHE